MKKSIEEAKTRAKEHSEKHPGDRVVVMDKKYKDAVVSSVEWVIKERILDGWIIVAEFRAGEQIK